MDFSIIIPVRNRPDEIQSCVASCYAQSYPPTKYEVIVVDNGSTDDTARRASRAGAKVVNEPEPNRCLARNLGAKVARGRWLAFIDSDCVADTGWLSEFAAMEEKLINSCEIRHTAAVAGQIVSAEPRNGVEAFIAKRRWIDQEKFLDDGMGFPPPFAATANLAIRADVFSEIGGFDPALKNAGEDADWCWRAGAKGYRIHYVEGAKVVHHHRATTGAMIRQAYNYGLGNADLFAKHRQGWQRRAWIEGRRYAWAVKGLLKTPYTALTARDPLERWFSWFDFLSNSAQAAGRLVGGWEHRIPMM